MYLSHKFTIIQMMHVSDHKPQKTFLDYIKLSSDEIADEIAVMSKKDGEMWRINNSLPKSDLLAIFLKQAFVNNKYYDYFCSPKSWPSDHFNGDWYDYKTWLLSELAHLK